MGKVKCRNPKTGTIYVYSSEGYRDEVTGQYKYRRRVIGKLDEYGNEVPTGPVGRPRKNSGNTNSNSSIDRNTVVSPPQVQDAPEYKEAMAQIQTWKEMYLDLQSRYNEQKDAYIRLQRDVKKFIQQNSQGLDALKQALRDMS